MELWIIWSAYFRSKSRAGGNTVSHRSASPEPRAQHPWSSVGSAWQKTEQKAVDIKKLLLQEAFKTNSKKAYLRVSIKVSIPNIDFQAYYKLALFALSHVGLHKFK